MKKLRISAGLVARYRVYKPTLQPDRMDELPLQWHDVDNCGYVLLAISYELDENGEGAPVGEH